MKRIVVSGAVALLTIAIFSLAAFQEIETVDGIKVIHNVKGGKWGKSPLIKLEHIRTLGDPDSPDENTAFYLPACVAVDGAGNVYVLGSGNHRIQKFGPGGKFLASLGRQGQGPGEMFHPGWLDIDGSGNLYVTDAHNGRVQVLSPEGKEVKTIRFIGEGPGSAFLSRKEPGHLIMGRPSVRFGVSAGPDDKKSTPPGLVRVADETGKIVRSFAAARDFGDELLNSSLNEAIITVGRAGEVFIVYPFQNKLEKYDASGKLLWRADRELAYDMEVKDKGKIERSGGSVSVMMPRLNRAAAGASVDDKGRVWVVTYARQLKKEEQVGMMVGMTQSMGGGRSVSYKVQGDTELRNTNAFKLEIFDGDGILLGEIPLDVFVDGIFISGDRVFLLDKMRGARILEYRIKD